MNENKVNTKDIEELDENKKKKARIGNLVYKICLISTTVFLLYILFFIKNDDPVKLSLTRYICCFYCFGAIIPIGLIIREILVEDFIMKKLIIKIVLTAAVLALGTVLLIAINTPQMGLATVFLSVGLLLFTAVPTNRDNQKK